VPNRWQLHLLCRGRQSNLRLIDDRLSHRGTIARKTSRNRPGVDGPALFYSRKIHNNYLVTKKNLRRRNRAYVDSTGSCLTSLWGNHHRHLFVTPMDDKKWHEIFYSALIQKCCAHAQQLVSPRTLRATTRVSATVFLCSRPLQKIPGGNALLSTQTAHGLCENILFPPPASRRSGAQFCRAVRGLPPVAIVQSPEGT